MRVFPRHFSILGLLFLPLFLISCSDGGGGGGPDLKYTADLDDETPGCLMRLEYYGSNGFRHVQDDEVPPWTYFFTQTDGARLYLSVEPDCGLARAELYINGDRVARETSFFKAEIDGFLRIDSAGNAWFDPS